MCWSGLRGAVGLALGLQIYWDEDLPPNFRAMQFFHIGVVALLTIFCQGTSMKFLLRVSDDVLPERLALAMNDLLSGSPYVLPITLLSPESELQCYGKHFMQISHLKIPW